MSQSETPAPKPLRGFAAMTPEKVKELAKKGGKAAHAAGTAHRWGSEDARDAGRKGGAAPHVVRGRGAKRPEVPPAAETTRGLEDS